MPTEVDMVQTRIIHVAAGYLSSRNDGYAREAARKELETELQKDGQFDIVKAYIKRILMENPKEGEDGK